MEFMLVTEDTSQPFRGWLKADAKANMERMPVTEDTSQAPMFGLHVSRMLAPFQRGRSCSGVPEHELRFVSDAPQQPVR